MGNSKRTFIFLLFIMIVLAAGPASAIEAGQPAPDFRLKSVAGQDVSLSDFRGQVALLKLTTTWCPTCKELSAEIEKVGDQLKAAGVVYLEVFVQDTEQMIGSYLEGRHNPMPYHALQDDGRVYEAYNVYMIPRLLLVDAEQVVRFDGVGQNLLADDILALARQASTPAAATK